MIVLQWLKSYLKSFSRKDFYYLVIIVILFLYYLRSCNSLPSQVIQPPYKPVQHNTDQNGNSYTQISGTLYTSEQMKQMVDSIAKVLRVKPGAITNVTNTITNIDSHISTNSTIYLDTFNHTITDSISTKDYFLSYNGNYATRIGNFHIKLSPDTATYIGILNKRLLRPDKYQVNIYHTNKLFEPEQGNTYSSTIPKTIAVVGPFLGLAYNGNVVPVIGVGITFNVLSIKRKK